jgi:hypothetical protein
MVISDFGLITGIERAFPFPSVDAPYPSKSRGNLDQ